MARSAKPKPPPKRFRFKQGTLVVGPGRNEFGVVRRHKRFSIHIRHFGVDMTRTYNNNGAIVAAVWTFHGPIKR